MVALDEKSGNYQRSQMSLQNLMTIHLTFVVIFQSERQCRTCQSTDSTIYRATPLAWLTIRTAM